MKRKKILIVTGGGDAPGLNAVIRAVVKHAVGTLEWDVVGSIGAFNGVLNDPIQIMPLDLKAVSGLLVRGGTIIGTSNKGGPFEFPIRNGAGELETVDRSEELLKRLHELGIYAVINIGGDGSQDISQRLFEMGLNIVGVPKTIDNDLCSTEMTFGFQTAVETATEAIDKLQTTAESHDRVMVLEVMGRYAGWIALASGIAGGADVILIPEIPYHIEKICERIRLRDKRGMRFAIVVVAEGAFPKGGAPLIEEERKPGQPNPLLGGIGRWVSGQIKERLGVDTRVTVLGHLQRGGVPAPMDRLLATRFGTAAVDLIKEEKFGNIVCLQKEDIVAVPIKKAIHQYRVVAEDHNLIRTARELGISLGD
ncbi:MAG: ATP-dependent 6-phosphofructokinase [Deltaproteobacteria bacterium]|nr:ATP-dependent 6-phosphofructokinase [Deltaproteobacteria bacterium]